MHSSNQLKYFLIVCLFATIPNCLGVDAKNLTDENQLDEEDSNLQTRSIVVDNLDSLDNDQRLYVDLSNAIEHVQSPQCLMHLRKLMEGVIMRRPWAIAMYDSSAKASTGVEFGSVYQFGNFDECLDSEVGIKSDGVDMQPKYCLADIVVDGYNIRDLATRQGYNTINFTTIHWAVCMPSTCTEDDIVIFLQEATNYKNITLEASKCTQNVPLEYSSSEIIFGSIVLGLVTMTIFCTIYHICTAFSRTKPSKSCLEMTFLSFSLIENLKKLIKGSNDDLGLGAINGIKAISMFFIISGHTLMFMAGGPVLNSNFFAREINLVQNALFINSTLLVDTFLFLSGFLFSRLLLIEIEKRRGQINFLTIYVFRYIRLTPAYLMMIGLYSTWFYRIGSGPLWNSRIGIERDRCQSSWWINLLYINNYVGTDKICMFQSWYLAADTQLFVLAPLILYPMWRWKRIGFTMLAAAGLTSTVLPFLLTYFNQWDPSLLAYPDEVVDISVNEFFVTGYIKTHMRMTGYLMGIFFGYLVHVIQEKSIKIPPRIVAVSWLFTIIIGFASLSLLTTFFFRTFTPLESASYAAFHRLGWSLATAWIVLACVTNNAGPLKAILSSRALVPFSRLTYCAYLTNGFVELYSAASVRAPRYMSIISLTGEASSHIWLTFLTALVICLIFESPIHGIEKIFLRKDQERRLKSTGNSETTTQEEV